MKSEIVKKNSPVIHLLVATLSLLPLSLTAQQLDRTVLPIAEPNYPHSTVLDARDAKPPPRFEVKAPASAPNVLIVLVDHAPHHVPAMAFSADETAGVGVDDATPVTSDYKERDNAFAGKIIKVTVDVKPIGAAIKAEEDSGRRIAGVKKALSD